MFLHNLLHKLNKKGGVNWKIIALIVVIMTIIVVLIIWGLMSGVFGEEAMDTACSFFSVTRLTATGPAGGKLGIFPETCISRPEDIYPTKWSECDPKFKPDKLTGEAGDPNRCASQQIADLVVRCWKMRGRGEADPTNIECFTACVHHCGDFCEREDIEFEVTLNMVRDIIKKYNMTGTDEPYSTFIKPGEIVKNEWSVDEEIGPTEHWLFEDKHIKGGEVWGIAFYDDWDIAYTIEMSDDRISINYKFPCYD